VAQQYPTDETRRVPMGTADRVLDESPGVSGATEYRTVAPSTRTEYRETLTVPRDHVRWGPVLAGTAVGLGATIIMSVLGLAIGSSAFEPGTDLSDWGTGAGIWGAVTALVAFFAAGWVAGRSATLRDSGSSTLTGFVAGAALLVTLIVLTSMGATNLMGFLGSNFSNVVDFASSNAAAEGAGTFDTVEEGAWATFIVMVVAMIVAALGGLIGHNKEDEYGPAI